MPLFKITRRFKAGDARQTTADIFVDAVDAQAAMTLVLQSDPDLSDARFENQLSPAVEVTAVVAPAGEAVKR